MILTFEVIRGWSKKPPVDKYKFYDQQGRLVLQIDSIFMRRQLVGNATLIQRVIDLAPDQDEFRHAMCSLVPRPQWLDRIFKENNLL